MDNARRRLRNARFGLGQYPKALHEDNASGLSAYSARDRLLILEDGPAVEVNAELVAHHHALVDSLQSLFEDLQRWTSAAGVRTDHPWRLAGGGNGDPFDVAEVSEAIDRVFEGTRRAAQTSGGLGDALASMTHPRQLDALIAGAQPGLPGGPTLTAILAPDWPSKASTTIQACEESVAGWQHRLGQFPPEVLDLDLSQMAADFQAASTSRFIGRKNACPAC